MTEYSPFTLPFALIVLVVMQFATAFLGWWLKRPLLPVVSTGVLTGAVFGSVLSQALPSLFGTALSVILSVAVACTYCAVMDKALSRLIHQ